MSESIGQQAPLGTKVKVFGTIFLVFQLLFAANNFGPQKIPGLSSVFSKPWVAAKVVVAPSGDLASQLLDVTPGSGLDAFKTIRFNPEKPTYLEVMNGGVAVGDYDGDGLDDVLITNIPAIDAGGPAGTPTTLFKGDGQGNFRDTTAEAGLSNLKGWPQGALFFDFDNDDDQDLYIAAFDGGQMFRNDGGRFTDITEASGLALGRRGEFASYSSTASAADYDLDGDLDLAIVNNVDWDITNMAVRTEPNLFPVFFDAQRASLFRNDGDGTFTDVTESSKLDNHMGKGLQVVWTDVNADGYPDAYFSNDISRNTLYVNNRDGTFSEMGSAAGVDEVKSSMGIAVGDYDNDGKMDLAVSNLKGSMISLYHNNGGVFSYATADVGLTGSGKTSGWGIAFADLDLDGWQDLVLAGGPVFDPKKSETQNMVFRNMGGASFMDVGKSSGLLNDKAVSRGLAVLDYNTDGCPDLLIANTDGDGPQLLANKPAAKNGYLNLRLRGTQSNRDGIGAKVEVVRADGVTLTQEVRAGSSYQSSSTKTLFFGLGESTANELKITWPSGQVDVIPNPGINRRLLVTEGEATPSELR